MTVAIGVVVAALVVAAIAMRRYLVRRDRRSSANRPLLEAPPSPYQSAKGFRLIDGATPSPRQTPAPPRLEPSEEYVFSDPTLGPEEVGVSPHRLFVGLERWCRHPGEVTGPKSSPDRASSIAGQSHRRGRRLDEAVSHECAQ